MGLLADHFTKPKGDNPVARGYHNLPDANGHFGRYGGRFVAETLMPLLLELESAYMTARSQPEFWLELEELLSHYVGRPSPLYHAKRFSAQLGGAQVWFKRDELNHTGAHKINHCLGQILLAKRMGKTRIIAETGAGQHGVATATVAALFGLPCTVYMGVEDVRRQSPNVFRMRLLGAEVVPVTSGTMTLKDATNEALRDWVNHVDDTFYILGSVVGPHPYPMMVRDFQSIIGLEARQQILAQAGQLPDMAVACVGGGSNAMGLFYGFLEDAAVQLIGVEAAGHGLDRQHAATLSAGSPGVLHGTFSYLLQDSDGQIAEAHSISAGLDYPGVGPEHAYLKDQGRVGHRAITDTQALEAFQFCARTEGILAALEPSHALAAVMQLAPTMTPDQHLVVNLCGRGDKDIFTIAEALKDSVVMPDIPTTSSKPAHASITGAAS
jgi:tryptophan synthase beta chain